MRFKYAEQLCSQAKGLRLRAAMAVRDQVAHNLQGAHPHFNYEDYKETRRHGRVFAKVVKRIYADPRFSQTSYPNWNGPGPEPQPFALDLSPAEKAAIDHLHTSQTFVPQTVYPLGPLTCALTGTPFLELNRQPRYRQNKAVEICEAARVAGAVKVKGRWYANSAALEGRKVVVWKTYGQNECSEDFEEHAPAGLVDIKGQMWAIGHPIAGYHSGVERQNLQPRTSLHAGTELEFHRGTLGSVEIAEAARKVLLASEMRNIVEQDGSITGFEIITGHAEPHVLRDLAVRPVFANRPLAGMRASVTTGQHVHVSRGETSVGRFAELAQAFMPDYKRLAGRKFNNYADYTVMEHRRSCIGLTENTYEFRLFRNPGNMPRVMANLQFAWSVVKFAAAGHTDYFKDFEAFLHDGLPKEDTVELRAYRELHNPTTKKRSQVEAELRTYYPAGGGVIGVARALSS